MILEIATFQIVPGQEADFERAFGRAAQVIAQAKGHLDHELLRSHEDPSQFVLLVHWRSLEDHTEGFRGSALFGQWRALLGPHFAQPPAVSHFTACRGA